MAWYHIVGITVVAWFGLSILLAGSWPDPVVKYETAPGLSLRYPDCSACAVEVESDGDGWNCPRCGTSWSYDAYDGDEGTLYEDWAGEENEGELRTHDEGYLPTQYERDNPKPSIWGELGKQLGDALGGDNNG